MGKWRVKSSNNMQCFKSEAFNDRQHIIRAPAIITLRAEPTSILIGLATPALFPTSYVRRYVYMHGEGCRPVLFGHVSADEEKTENAKGNLMLIWFINL